MQHIQLESDLNMKLKAQAKLNFSTCFSHPSCLLISSAISFSFSCLLFSQQLTVLQVNVLSYPLFRSHLSYIFSLFHYYSQIPSTLDEVGLYNSTIVEMKTNDAHYVFSYAVFPKTSKRLHLQAIRYLIHETHFLSSYNHWYRLNVKYISISFWNLTSVTLYKNFTRKSLWQCVLRKYIL